MNYKECTQRKPLCKLIQKLMLSGATMSYMLPYSCECDEYASFLPFFFPAKSVKGISLS